MGSRGFRFKPDSYCGKNDSMTTVAYHLYQPKRQTTAVVFSSPHSGRDYPQAFLDSSVLDERRLRSSEDAFVDDLFAAAVDNGAPLLAASAPRAYVDLNRSADDLDPAVVRGVAANRTNARVASGLGVIPRVVAEGRAIRSGKITYAEAVERLEAFYHPYHRQLRALISDCHAQFGSALLIDCHSMPSEALSNHVGSSATRPQVILGDRFGATCDKRYVDQIEGFFRQEGFSVMRNSPFAGAFITQFYGRPALGQHAVQIEIDRSLYMNEHLVRPNGNFAAFQTLLSSVVADITRIGRRSLSLAAE